MVRIIVDKLTPIIRNKWFDRVAREDDEVLELKRLSTFLTEEADKCAVYAPVEIPFDKSRPAKKPKRQFATKTKIQHASDVYTRPQHH